MKRLVLVLLTLFCANLGASAQGPCAFSIIGVTQSSGSTVMYPDLADTSDVASILWSTGETDFVISTNVPGTYCLLLTFDSGCSDTSCYTVSAPSSNCGVDIYEDSTGNLMANAYNGQAPYTYLWSNGSTYNTVYSDVPGQTFCVTVTDNVGCTADTCIVTTVEVCTTEVHAQLVQATGDLILSTVQYGSAPYTYLWSTGETTPTITVAPDSTLYSVTVTDANGCSSFNSELALPILPPTCSAWIDSIYGNFLWAHFSGSGGATFLWSNGVTSDTIMPSSAGNYCVTATESNGCTAVACAYFTPPPPCTMTTAAIIDGSSGHHNVTVDIQGGVAPFSYNWRYGSSPTITSTDSELPLVMARMPYNVTVTDANGCTSTATYDSDECLLAVSYELVETGEYKVLWDFKGVGFVEYDWDFGLTGGISGGGRVYEYFQNAGSYCITITDANSCTKSECITLPDCGILLFEKVDGSIEAATNGASPISISWSEPSLSGNPVFPPSNWDTLCVTMTDHNGCVASDCILNTGQTLDSCDTYIQKYIGGGDTVRLVASSTQSSNLVLSYQWSTGSTSYFTNVNTSGNYCVTVTYVNGCTATDCYDLIAGNALKVRIGFDGPGSTADEIGDLWLIEYDSVAGSLTALDTIPFVDGIGDFIDVPLGTYLVKASLSPASGEYQNYMPTYYFEELLWDAAEEVIVDNLFEEKYIFLDLLGGQNPGGPGFVGGQVAQGANKGIVSVGNTVEIAGVSLLLTFSDGTPVAHVLTDTNGNFEFPSLTYGTYHLWVDIPGLTPVYKEITINAANPSIRTLEILVDEDSTNFVGIFESTRTVEQLNINPNPAQNIATIRLDGLHDVLSNIRVVNKLGQTIFQVQSTQNTVYQLDMSMWNSGTYTVFIHTENGKIAVGKLIKL